MRVKDIIERVLLLYHDENYLRIKQQQYLQLLDDAILQLILTRPDAHEKRDVMKLSPGPRQHLPEEAFSLIDIYSNKFKIAEPDEYTDGKPVFQVARKDLDYFSNWYDNLDEHTQIDEFAFDVRSPKQFWVNPPVAETVPIYIEIGYSYQHPQYSLMTEDYDDILEMELEVSDEFRNAIINYLLYLLYSTDSTSELDRSIADKYLNNFYQLLGVDGKSSLEAYPHILERTTQGLNLHGANVAPTGA